MSKRRKKNHIQILKLHFKVTYEYENGLDLHKLVISNITMNDAGEYKCQVENTNPKLEQVISKVIKCQCNKYTIYLIFACYKISKASWLSVKAKAKRPFLKVRIVSYGPKYQYLFLITFMLSLSKVKLFSGQLTNPKLPFFSFIFRWLHWKQKQQFLHQPDQD